MIDRRAFLGTVASGLLASRVLAQSTPPKRLFTTRIQPDSASFIVAFEARLRELGWEPGRSLIVKVGRIETPDQYGPAFADAVRSGVDVIFAAGPQQALASARAATKTVPIIIAALNYDPIASGYVSSLARPAGNVTGVSMQQTEYTAKRVELLREALPAARRVAILYDVYGDAFLQPAETAARALGLATRVIRVADTGSNLEEKLREAAAQPATSVLLLGSPIFFRERRRIAVQALALRLPVMGTGIEGVEAGQLLYFGPSLVEIYRRCAEYVDKVLRGADPASLPIEQPTKFELAFNLRTAKALNVVIPRAMLLRAETVIQ